MSELIISSLSLLILLPIMYFLPLNFTKKGKVSLVVVAFLLANVGLLARDIFQLWQILLILFLLVFLTAYIFDKRFSKQLYINESSSEKSLDTLYFQEAAPTIEDTLQENVNDLDTENEKIDDMIENDDELIEHSVEINTENDEEVMDTFIDLNKENSEDEIFAEQDEEIEIQLIESLIDKDEVSELIDDEKEIKVSEEPEDINIDDDISFLIDRQISMEEDIEVEEEFLQSEGYLSEIEKLLESDNLIDSEEVAEKNNINGEDIEPSNLNYLKDTDRDKNDESFDFDMLLAEKRTVSQEEEKEKD